MVALGFTRFAYALLLPGMQASLHWSLGDAGALNTANGKKRWTFTAKGPFIASPVLNGNTLYIGSTDNTLYALDATNGKVRWRYDTGSPVFATAAVAKGTVCVGGNQTIHGVDAASGKMRWTQKTGRFFQSRAATASASGWRFSPARVTPAG